MSTQNMNAKVAWTEGMLLTPQHLQQLERHWACNWQQFFQMQAHSFGFQEIEIDRNLLSLGRINVQIARGFFQDGSSFFFQQDTSLPATRLLENIRFPADIYLAIPHYDKRYKTRNLELKYEHHDETPHIESRTVIAIQEWNACFLTEQEDLSEYQTLPIARVLEIHSNNKIILDENFVPPCTQLSASPFLLSLHHEMYQLLKQRCLSLAHRLSHSETADSSGISDLLLLSTFNRFLAGFTHFEYHQQHHPEKIFLFFYTLLSELSSFTNNDRYLAQNFLYQHHNLKESFTTLCDALRNALQTSLEQHAKKIALQIENNGIWHAPISDVRQLHENEFVLGLYADLPPLLIKERIPLQIKIAAFSLLPNLISRSLPGIPVHILEVIPRQIPYHANFTYFTLEKHTELWKLLQESPEIGIHISGSLPGLKIELWSVKG